MLDNTLLCQYGPFPRAITLKHLNSLSFTQPPLKLIDILNEFILLKNKRKKNRMTNVDTNALFWK